MLSFEICHDFAHRISQMEKECSIKSDLTDVNLAMGSAIAQCQRY